MASRKFETHYAVYMEGDDLPKKYKDEMDQIFTTAEAIHGPSFVRHLKFMINMESLLGVLIQHTELKEGVPLRFIRDTTSTIASQLVGAYGEAQGLSREQMSEAVNLCKTMRGVLETMERDIKKGRK